MLLVASRAAVTKKLRLVESGARIAHGILCDPLRLCVPCVGWLQWQLQLQLRM